ncbi:PTS sugar transporter subunit IIA [Nesterenkonia sp. F]|uniref:PTS sugar transporter subunit IIA n=1 Tax=Nesterenkonia sp. F TaxID=795955 RepID=UPI000255D243|nr:PTS sugar transporter subunit IIA [Nesterenkonia sp. F]
MASSTAHQPDDQRPDGQTDSPAALLAEESIALDVVAADWREAVDEAGRLLVAAGVADDDYTAAMRQVVEEHGPYIVVAPGFALAHARPTAGVARTGLSWVRLAEPVPFGHSSHDPVGLVVGLAADDDVSHTRTMARLARLLADPRRREELEAADSPRRLRGLLTAAERPEASAEAATDGPEEAAADGSTATDRHLILTVCGNGLGTSLFLKNTLEQVLDTWRWAPFVIVEATDTISARGRSSEATAILTSGEIAKTLGDVDVPIRVVENFTSTIELDAALRDLYDV